MNKDYNVEKCEVKEEKNKTPINSVIAEMEDKWEDEMSSRGSYHSSNGFWWNSWC